jgi:hypothetical protein
MGNYAYLEMAGKYTEIIELFAKKTAGVAIEISDLGIWDGVEGIKKLFEAVKRHEGNRVGILNVHPVTTPDYSVSRDGITAKGVWFTPGIETLMVEGKPKAYFSYHRYGVDFVNEDDQWKIWHFHTYLIYRKPYAPMLGFMMGGTQEVVYPAMKIPDEFKPDRPSTTQNEYHSNTVQVLIPRPPAPFPFADVETFNDRTSYIKSEMKPGGMFPDAMQQGKK